MARIIAGEFGGRRLRTPEGTQTRPTTDRTRESLFASLEATADLDGGPFVDLFAGSGAVGLEALSRGAPYAYLIDDSPSARAAIQANVETLGLAARCTTLPMTAQASVSSLAGVAATTVFADPPYDLSSDDLGELLAALLEAGAMHQDATVVVERSRRTAWSWPTQFEALRDRRYGDARLWYGRPL